MTVDVTKDPKANGLKQKDGNQKFISITYLMVEVMAPSPGFAISPDGQLRHCRGWSQSWTMYWHVTGNEGNEWRLCRKVQWLSERRHVSRDIKIPDSSLDLQSLCNSFIDSLVENLQAHFTVNGRYLLYCCFGIIAMRLFSFLGLEECSKYSVAEIKALCKHYGHLQQHELLDEGVKRVAISDPVVITEQTHRKWSEVKPAVLAWQYPRDCTWKLWSFINQHKDQFLNLAKLVNRCVTAAVHTAGCKRGSHNKTWIWLLVETH